MIMAESDGVGLKSEQLTTTTPIWRGCTPVLASTSLIDEKQTCSNSQRASDIEIAGGDSLSPGGRYVSSPSPERSRIFPWNSTLRSVNLPHATVLRICAALSMRHDSGGRYTE